MIFWFLMPLIDASVLTDESAQRPMILQVQYSLAGNLFTGSATGWPTRAGQWNWLTAVVRNPLDRELNASLVFRTGVIPDEGQFSLSRPFRLPPHADLRVSFPVQSQPDALTGRRENPVELVLLADGERYDQHRAVWTFLENNIHVLGVIGQDARLGSLLNGHTIYADRGPQLQSPGLVRTLQIPDEYVPDDPLGLDLLQTLVVVHPQERRLRALQWSAIDQWVQGGGDLIVATGSDVELQNQPDLEAMLPAQPIGTRTVTVLPCTTQWSGEEIACLEGLVLSESIVRRGEVLLWDGHNPLVVRGRHGLGTVTCVAIDPNPELLRSSAYRKFWLRLLRELQQPAVLDAARLAPAIPSIVEQFAGRELIGIWFPLLLLGSYLAAVTVLAGFRPVGVRQRPRWDWICAAAFLFAGAIHLLMGLLAPDPSNALYDLWIAHGTNRSQVMRFSGHVSLIPAARGPERMEIGRGVRVTPNREAGMAATRAEFGVVNTTVDYHAEQGRVRTIRASGYVRMNGIDVHGRAGSGGVAMEIDNRSPYDLQAAFLRFGRRILPVGDLPKGGHRTFLVGAGRDSGASDTYEDAGLLNEAARLRQSILHGLFVDPDSLGNDEFILRAHRGAEQGTSSHAMFGGWVNRSALDIAWHHGPDAGETGDQRHALGLWAIVPEFTVVEDEFLVPKGGMTLGLPDTNAQQYYFGKSTFRGEQPVTSSTLTLRFDVPAWARAAEITQAKVFVHFAAEAYRLRVFSGEEQLQMPDVPSGSYTVPLKDSGSPARSVELRLVIEPSAEFATDRAWADNRWSLHEVDVECLCRRVPSGDGEPAPESDALGNRHHD